MTEYWLPVEGWVHYEVSSLGRVRRILPDGRTRVLKPYVNGKGYRQVDLRQRGKARCEPGVHQLVCFAFNGPPPEDGQSYDCHHKRTKENDYADNLEWVIHREHWRKKYNRH